MSDDITANFVVLVFGLLALWAGLGILRSDDAKDQTFVARSFGFGWAGLGAVLSLITTLRLIF